MNNQVDYDDAREIALNRTGMSNLHQIGYSLIHLLVHFGLVRQILPKMFLDSFRISPIWCQSCPMKILSEILA